MQVRLKDMIYVGTEAYSGYSAYVVNYRSDYDIVKLLEDLLNANASSFEVNKELKQVRAMTPRGFKLQRVF